MTMVEGDFSSPLIREEEGKRSPSRIKERILDKIEIVNEEIRVTDERRAPPVWSKAIANRSAFRRHWSQFRQPSRATNPNE